MQGTIKSKQILPCQDFTLLDILASIFFAFLSFALLRFLEGILKEILAFVNTLDDWRHVLEYTTVYDWYIIQGKE